MTNVDVYNFRLRKLEEALELSRRLAKNFRDPEANVTGIYELLLNAIEHGNLGLGYEMKSDLVRAGKWRDEIDRRLALPEFREREVEIKLVHNQTICCLTIADQGRGFAWQDYVHRLSCGRRPNGRGLWIAFNSPFDNIKFNEAGNVVTCVGKYWR
ncbi:MAG: ATP-binding protein [Alphaproteobacteria bacterium]|nr:ATP-binding protein [Alphaproteobacteria bacterium]